MDGRSLNAWRLKLERPRRTRRPTKRVELIELKPTGAQVVENQDRSLVVRLGAFTVEVGNDFDESALSRVLKVVARC